MKKYTGVSQSLAVVSAGHPYSCLIWMGRWLGGGKTGRNLSVWCLCEDWRKAFCLPGEYGVSWAHRAASKPCQSLSRWYTLCSALDRGIGTGILALRMPACFRFAHHRPENGTHGGDGAVEWGCSQQVHQGLHCPLFTQRHSACMSTHQKGHCLSAHPN